MTPPLVHTGTYVGWLREAGGQWQAVAHGTTECAAFRLLLAVKSSASNVERLVTRGGRHPDDRKRPR